MQLPHDVSIHIETIEHEAKRIAKALKDFSETQNYETEQIGKTIGVMAVPGKH